MGGPDVDRVAAIGAKRAGSARRPRCRATCFPMGSSPEYKAAHKGRPHLDAAWDGAGR